MYCKYSRENIVTTRGMTSQTTPGQFYNGIWIVDQDIFFALIYHILKLTRHHSDHIRGTTSLTSSRQFYNGI